MVLDLNLKKFTSLSHVSEIKCIFAAKIPKT